MCCQGHQVLPDIGANYFDISFAGMTVRFLFIVAKDDSACLKGLVKCKPVGMDGKPMDILVGEFSFNRQAETPFMTSDGDPLGIDSEWGAGYLVLHVLSEVLTRMTEPSGLANSARR